jgi:hypothetical protein
MALFTNNGRPVNGGRTKLRTPPEAKLVKVKAGDVEQLPQLAHLWRPDVVMQGHKIQWTTVGRTSISD